MPERSGDLVAQPEVIATRVTGLLILGRIHRCGLSKDLINLFADLNI